MFVCGTKTRTILIRKRGFFFIMAGREQNMASMWKKMTKNGRSWRPNIISWHHVFGMHSTWRHSERNHSRWLQINVRITDFCWSNWKHCQGERNFTQKLSRAPTTRKVMRNGALKGTVSWQTEWQRSCTKCQLLAWMTITSRKRTWKQLDYCHKYALRLSWHACIWHELVGRTFYSK